MLKNVRVVDFSRFIPGPLASQRLADLGAEVIKVEPPLTGDPLRYKELGLPFRAVKRNKKSVTLDLKADEGQKLAFQKVYNLIKQKILSYQLIPGQKLQYQDLADEFGVSRTPVKNALILLEQEGFVVLHPNKGYYIISS